MFLAILERKLKARGVALNKINTWSVKASQYDHTENTYRKKKLSQRWDNIGGIAVQRDMYSAFLIRNVTPDLLAVDKDKCNERFDDFIRLHNNQVQMLTGKKNLASIAI